MDSPPLAPELSRSNRMRVGMIIGALALLAVVIFEITKPSKTASPEPPFVWVDPAQFARQMRPGKLKLLYYRGLNLRFCYLRNYKTLQNCITRATVCVGGSSAVCATDASR